MYNYASINLYNKKYLKTNFGKTVDLSTGTTVVKHIDLEDDTYIRDVEKYKYLGVVLH